MHFAALFHPKAKQWVQGRKGLLRRIEEEVEPGYIIWIHAASVGEFEQARPLIEKIKEEYPNKKILVTFFSPSGYELRKNYGLADYVYYLPIDTKKNAHRFIELIKPEMAFFIKYEYWFNYLNELYKRVIPIYLVSAVFRPSQHFFKWYGSWFRKHLRMVEWFFVQDIESAKLLGSLKIKRFSVVGDTRFDRVRSLIQNPKSFANINDFCAGEKVLLAGSSWEADEKLLFDFIENEQRDFKLIIAPHEVNEEHIKQLQKRFGKYEPLLLSDYEDAGLPKGRRVLIIDSVGKLMHLYQYADVAYIGGGFGVGIHNILEAATYGKPVIFGPNYHKFNEAKALIERKGGFSISDKAGLQSIAARLLFDRESYAKAARQCTEYVAENIGATDKIFEEAFEIK
jgi:3-deoxy-D-manno-octulosonic-acid transferase